jgi:hypothetical protein
MTLTIWMLPPVAMILGILAACLLWRWDIGGFRTDAERRMAERKDKK